MAYPKLPEGNRPFSAVSGNPILAADHNELQDQLAAMLGPLNVPLQLTNALQDNSLSVRWHYRKALGWWAWQNVTAVTTLVHDIGTLRVGQKITAMSVTLRGTTTGGSVTLYRQKISTPAAPTSVATWAADPWATAGADIARAATSGLPHTVLSDWRYYIEFVPSAVDPQYISGGYYTIQFGS